MEKLIQLMPYIVSIVTAVISGVSSYCLSRRKFKNELETIKLNNEHEINKLMEQHKVDIENLKEKHKLELERKEIDYMHEKEIMKLKSDITIVENTQKAMSGVIATTAKDIIDGKISPEKIKELQQYFPAEQ